MHSRDSIHWALTIVWKEGGKEGPVTAVMELTGYSEYKCQTNGEFHQDVVNAGIEIRLQPFGWWLRAAEPGQL